MAAYRYQPGDQPLDGYTIQYALGKGGFGEVYFAVSDSGREVALKAVQNFEDIELRGIGHCMNLKSPHLVMIFDIKRSADGIPWVIMEYVAGASLREILDESPDGLSVEQATFFFRELAKGISYLHEAGVVHRDLKPHNVFFEDGIVKIGDYSLSKVITASHRSGNTMTVGSVHYMAPEISLGRYDKTVDIYALGVMLYEMLTGRPPYVGESMGEVLMKHLSSDPDVSSLPEPFASAVRKAMQRDPAHRFQTAEEMVAAITTTDAANPVPADFNPATLSMIGEKARQTKSSRRRDNVPAVEDHSTAPTAVQETFSQPETNEPVAPSAVSMILQRCALHYRPPERLHQMPDSVTWQTRLLLAGMAAIALLFFGFRTVGIPFWPGDELLPLTQFTVAIYGLTAAAFAWWIPDRAEGWWPLASRLIWAAPAGVSILFAANATRIGPDVGAPLLFSLIVCAVVFDWRCFTAVHRESRIMLLPTVLVGVTAAFVHFLCDGYVSLTTLTSALAIAVALTVQLVAPVRRAAADAPALKRPAPMPRRAGEGRLRFDKTAIVLELLAGAAAMVIIGTIGSGYGDLIGFAVVAAVVGFVALRLRLARRDDMIAKIQDSYTDSVIPGQAEIQPRTLRSRLHENEGDLPKLDKLSVFLEAVIIGAIALLCLFVYWQDDDFIPGGIAAVVIAFLAFRLRVRRRRYLLRHADQPQNNSPIARTQSRLRFDTISILLELLTGACIVTVAGLIIEGDDDLFVLGAAAFVVGIVALRFRLSRRYEEYAVSAPATERDQKVQDADPVNREMQEIR
ncbi:MAG: protein kinase [Planctomycetaceae bacterium]